LAVERFPTSLLDFRFCPERRVSPPQVPLFLRLPAIASTKVMALSVQF